MIPIEERSKYCVCLVAELSENMVVDKELSIPWTIPEDKNMIKILTEDNTVIMDHNTYFEIGAELTTNSIIVVSCSYKSNLVKVVESIDDAVELAGKAKIFVLGGPSLYTEGFPFATHMLLTIYHSYRTGSNYFPDFDEKEWAVVDHVQEGSRSIVSMKKLSESQQLARDSYII